MATSRRRFIHPRFPDERFFLESVTEGWTLGPFARSDFVTGPEGEQVYADSVTHPVVLKVRKQEGDVISANNGGLGDMDYRIVTVDEPRAQPWLAPPA